MIFQEKLHHTKEALLRLIYPADCAVCFKTLDLQESGICGKCRSRLEALCFSPEDSVLEDGKFESLSQGWAAAPYESPLKEILSSVKFDQKRWLTKLFPNLIRPVLRAITAENHYDMLIPVPIDRQKLVKREFNQAELFARLAAKETGIPSTTGVLIKPQPTPMQSRLGRKERLMNLSGAFQTVRKNLLKNKNILLVDDIFTTGATSDEAAAALLNAGARRVDIFAIASTPNSR